MKIALYYPWIYLTSGVERTILETLRRSRHEITVFTNRYEPENTFPEFNKYKVIELKRIPVRRDLISVIKAAVVIIFQKIDLSGFDVLLVHSEGLGDLILSRNSGIPVFCYCHTPLRPVFDESYIKEVFKNKNIFQKFIYYFFALVFKYLDRYLWTKYKKVFFNSRETLRRAVWGGLLSEDDSRAEILHPGVDTSSIKPSLTYKDYFFHPGRIMWTKNIGLSIESFINFKKLNPRFRKFKLIIAGRVDRKSKLYLRSLKRLSKGRKDIIFVIDPSDRIMKNYYKNSLAVISTSFNEDWGITLLEGNAFGKACIAVNSGGLKESQTSRVTGFLVELEINDISDAMQKLAGNRNLAIKLGSNARKNSLKYDWGKFIRQFDSKVPLG